MTLDEIKAHCHEIGECWEWKTNARTDRARRHPMIGKGTLVRRVAYEHVYGQVPADISLAPKCGNPYCINPAHQKRLTFSQQSALGGCFSPTRAANVAKTRRARGLNKLTPELVAEIRASAESERAIAKRLSLDKTTISYIRTRKTWKEYGADNPFAQLLASNDSASRRTA
jgi:hypothetical protein